MILKTKPLMVCVFVAVALSVSAQTQTKACLSPSPITVQANQPITDDGKEVVEPFNGTYRFVFTKGVKQVFTDEIFKTIETNRKENEEVIVTLSDYCKVQILSRNQINAIGFVPFSKSYVFEN